MIPHLTTHDALIVFGLWLFASLLAGCAFTLLAWSMRASDAWDELAKQPDRHLTLLPSDIEIRDIRIYDWSSEDVA